MKDLAAFLLRSLPSVIFISACWTLTGCATMDKIAQDEQAYNTQQCKAFGLTPGSDNYVQCMSQGANAYAAARANQPANTAAPAMAVIPIGIPVVPPPGKQASCSPGQEIPGGSSMCIQAASCTCQ